MFTRLVFSEVAIGIDVDDDAIDLMLLAVLLVLVDGDGGCVLTPSVCCSIMIYKE